MSERFRSDAGPASETKDEQLKELDAAYKAENRLWLEINGILESAPDRRAAEQRILVEYADRLGEAMKRTREAHDRWFAELTRQQNEYELKLNE